MVPALLVAMHASLLLELSTMALLLQDIIAWDRRKVVRTENR
jgi:hypothetical protein